MKKHYVLLAGILIMFSPQFSFAQWQATAGPLGAGHISSMAVAGPNILAGTTTGGVFFSSDSGATWTTSTGITNPSEARVLAVEGSNSFAGFYSSLSDTAVFLSADNGATWSGTNIAGIFLWSLAAKPGYLIAGTWYGVQYSTNNGTLWGGSSTGLPGNASVSALAFSGTKIFCGVAYSSSGGTGVFSSINSGTSWNPFNIGWASPIIGALAVVGPDVFAGTAGGGVYKSATTASNWSAVNTGLTIGNIRSLYVMGNNLYAGGDGGIFVTPNSGAGWYDISAGLPVSSKVYSITSDNVYLYAGADSMVWRRPLAEIITGIDRNNIPEPVVNVYPNPVLNELRVIINNNEQAEIILYDIISRKLLQQSFTNSDFIDTSQLEKGIYLYEVRTGNKIVKNGKVIKQ